MNELSTRLNVNLVLFELSSHLALSGEDRVFLIAEKAFVSLLSYLLKRPPVGVSGDFNSYSRIETKFPSLLLAKKYDCRH
jgi:hypothetical protein